MAGLVDLFYPDNKHRLDRLNELAEQCSLYQQEISTQKQDYDELIKTINEDVVKIFGSFQKVEMKDVKVPDGSIICQVAGGVASIFAGAGAVAAMNVAWKSWMLSQGRIGEAARISQMVSVCPFRRCYNSGICFGIHYNSDRGSCTKRSVESGNS